MPDFGQPDPPTVEVEETEVSAQKEPKPAAKAPTTSAPSDAYDLTEFIAQPREGASTGERQKLEANEFNDESLLQEAGYTADGDAPEVENSEVEVDGEPIEISDEWLEIFAWAGVELTDEAMPRLLQYLHAEDDHQRFKLPPNRRDKLKMAWVAFLRKVLPAWDDKQGLMAVIVMMYIENIVVGVWKTFGRVMSGTFEWPGFWPFTLFDKKDKEEEPVEETPSPSPAPQPQPTPEQMAFTAEPIVPAPSVVKAEPKPPLQFQLPEKAEQPKVEEPETVEPAKPTVHLAPVPTKMPGNQLQDPINGMPFDKGTGVPAVKKYPTEPWEKTHSKADGTRHTYRVPADTFRTQKSMQAWLHAEGFYKNRPEK